MANILFLDCDSTISKIEGIDELAALRGPEIEAQVIQLTNDAMDGRLPIQEIFARRLELIRPTKSMCDTIGELYKETLSPHVHEVLQELRESGWEPKIISGGFTQAIRPLATHLKIDDVFAVPLIFDESGNYHGFRRDAPTARNGGKPVVIAQYRKDHDVHKTVMVGDGISDWETSHVVDRFIGFGGVVNRPSVFERSKEYIFSFEELPKLLEDLSTNS